MNQHLDADLHDDVDKCPECGEWAETYAPFSFRCAHCGATWSAFDNPPDDGPDTHVLKAACPPWGKADR